MEIDINDALQFIIKFCLILSRLSGIFILAPTLSGKLLPTKVKISLVAILSVVLFPKIAIWNINIDVWQMILNIAGELVVGFLIGFVIFGVFQIFIYLGEIIAMQSGLGFASLNDPTSNSNIPVVGQFYSIILLMLFLSLEGHFMLIELLVESYNLLPLGGNIKDELAFKEIVSFGGFVVASAFHIALPAITSLLIINLSMGYLAKMAPQMNLLTIGFPALMIVGMLIMFLNLNKIYDHFDDKIANGNNIIAKALGKLNGR